MTSKYKVSTSEVATFLTCKQRWMYAHHPSYRLEPRTLGTALSRGIVGHAALEIYYRALKDGKSESDARNLSTNYLVESTLKAITVGDSEKAEMLGKLGERVKLYLESDVNQNMLKDREILGVELLVETPLPGCEDIYFAGRIDLALVETKPPSRGLVVPYDHKFTYNFWPDSAIKMNAQISNYVWALNQTGYRSNTGFLNMIRYRPDARDKFSQKGIETYPAMRDMFIRNHVEAAKQIVELKEKPTVGLEDGVTRSTSKFNCEYCPFVDLCTTEAKGLDSTLMRKASYRTNSYGYDSELDVA